MSRVFIGVLVIVTALLAPLPVRSQSAAPSLTVTPRLGGSETAREVVAAGLSANVVEAVVLWDPNGNQLVESAPTDASGRLDLHLPPPTGGWSQGLYRAAIPGSGSGALEGTFVVTDGKPHLYVVQSLPSVTSAVTFVGTGFAPNAHINFVFELANDRGSQPFPVSADGDGVFELSIYPAEVHEPFFEAGYYTGAVPSLGLAAQVLVREHPNGPRISVVGSAQAGEAVHLHLVSYAGNRYVRVILAGADGAGLASYLLGPTNRQGDVDGVVQFPPVPAGQYFLATPYDWGETMIAVEAAPATATPSPTVTPTPTPTDPPTATPRTVVRKPCKPGHVRKHGHCHPKKRKP